MPDACAVDSPQSLNPNVSRVLLVGNSVSMPPMEGVAAYPELLEIRLGDEWRLVRIIRGGETVDQFEPEVLSTLETTRPRAVILQVGINECGPRPLNRKERERLGRVWPRWLRSLLIRVIHHFRPQIIRARGPNQFTPLAVFAESVQRIIAKAESLGSAVLILPITQVTPTAEIRQPFFNREIERYNSILRAFKGNAIVYLEQQELLGDDTPEGFCISRESVHLNGRAHERIAACVSDWLDRSPNTGRLLRETRP